MPHVFRSRFRVKPNSRSALPRSTLRWSSEERCATCSREIWIEFGQLGAYGACLRTGFNGFGKVDLVEVADPPMLATPGYE